MKKNQTGFTLVEIMVSIAIIGILSAIAIPIFNTYQAKTRTNEAKLALAAIYSAQMTFRTESEQFGTCLYQMGYRPANHNAPSYDPTSGQEQRHYNVGFTKDLAYNNPAVPCNPSHKAYYGKKGENNPGIPSPSEKTPPGSLTQGSATKTQFTAIASGKVQRSFPANSDRWLINENKRLIHTKTGH